MSIFNQIIFNTLAVILLGNTGAASADNYVIDPDHTSTHFRVGHFHFSHVQGRFNRVRGTFSFDPASPGTSKVHVTVDTGSIDTNNKARDDHLRDPSYFNISRFPDAEFMSTSTVVTGTRTFLVSGNLTMLGVTVPVTLEATFNGSAPHPLGSEYVRYKNVIVAGFSARASISRNSFGMTNGRGAKGDKVELSIEVEGWKR